MKLVKLIFNSYFVWAGLFGALAGGRERTWLPPAVPGQSKAGQHNGTVWYRWEKASWKQRGIAFLMLHPLEQTRVRLTGLGHSFTDT